MKDLDLRHAKIQIHKSKSMQKQKQRTNQAQAVDKPSINLIKKNLDPDISRTDKEEANKSVVQAKKTKSKRKTQA